MKELVLTGKQIALLSKVSNAGWGFYNNVEDFLEANEELPENESVNFTVDEDELADMVAMISSYLGDDELSGDDVPTEEEKIDLQELSDKLVVLQQSDSEETVDADEEVDEERAENAAEENNEENISGERG